MHFITEEHNETVVHFGRVLSEKEKALMEICLAFFENYEISQGKIELESVSEDGQMFPDK